MSRFATVSEDQLDEILKNKNAVNTTKAMNVAWKVFTSYIDAKRLTPEFNDKVAMNDILRKFYVEVRKVNGEQYKKSALNSIRFGLQRKLKQIT